MRADRRRALVGAVVVATVLGAGTASAGRVRAASDFTVVAGNLDNPRGLTTGADGSIYAAAVGHGGDQACMPSPEGSTDCVGLTGALLRIAGGQVQTVASGFVSIAGQDTGMAAVGMDDVTLRDGQPYVIMTSAGPRLGAHLASGPLRGAAEHELGNVLRVNGGGNLAKVADIDDFEFSVNPVDDPDSDPYAIATAPDGSFIVADAAGNTVVRVTSGGTVSLVAALPDIVPGPPDNRVQAVPTGVAVGPDGDVYVSELASFAPGMASILRITPAGAVTTVASGLTAVTSVAVDQSTGTVYATEFSVAPDVSTGDVVRVARDGSVDHVAPSLVTPGGVTVTANGSVYVSNFSIFPASGPGPHGEVVRLTL